MITLVVVAALVGAGVDYRAAQSPVKDQNPRGTCAAFAVAAAIEAQPGTAIDVSEQFLYAIVKKRQLDLEAFRRRIPGLGPFLADGDPLSAYTGLFAYVGAPPEQVLPYQNGQVTVPDGTPAELAKYLKLAQITPDAVEAMRDAWGKYGLAPDGLRVLEGPEIRDVAKVRALLDSGVLAIPVGYTIHPPSWSLNDPAYLRGNDPQHPRFTPDHMEEFKREIDVTWMSWAEASAIARQNKVDLAAALGPLAVRLAAQGQPSPSAFKKLAWTARLREPVTDAAGELIYGGHAVTIVGYTDTGFIIKNSWGAAWGERGYAEISYDYHRLYASQGLEVRDASIRVPALSPFERNGRLAGAELHLKVQPIKRGAMETWRLSVYSMSMRDPPVEAVEYVIETEAPNGTWAERGRYLETARDVSKTRGFPITLGLAERFTLLGTAPRMRVTARLGFDLGPGGKPLAWAGTRTFGPFATRVDEMIDVVGR